MAQTGSKTVVGKVGRVAVPVTDQDRAIEFYTQKLGFNLDVDIPMSETYRWVEVSPPDGGAALAIVPPPDGKPTGVDTNVMLTTGDVDEAHAELRDRGVDVDAEVSRMGDPVPPMFWFRDQDGNTLLLVETPDEQ
jgi:catechol 2,3-dioxygenase-like lactoylglutathione lyase family enzyme